jgi:hypothetical protein
MKRVLPLRPKRQRKIHETIKAKDNFGLELEQTVYALASNTIDWCLTG